MLHLLRHSSEDVAALNFRFRLPFSSASECVALIRSNAVQVVRFRDHWIDYVDGEARGWVPHRPSVRPTATIRTTRERTSAACTGGFRIDLLIGRWLDGRLPDGSGPILFFPHRHIHDVISQCCCKRATSLTALLESCRLRYIWRRVCDPVRTLN